MSGGFIKMKLLRNAFPALCCAVLSFMGDNSLAQEKTIAQWQAELISSWRVTIEGDDRIRTLKINKVSQSPEGVLLLDADYGFSDGKQNAIRAEISQSGLSRRLTFTTQSDSDIAATQTPDGSFAGSFTNAKGKVKQVRISKLAETGVEAVPSTQAKPLTSEETAKLLAQLKSELTASWLVTVAGEDLVRLLKVKGVSHKANDSFLLEADYGGLAGVQTPVYAEIRQMDQERKLILTTQYDSKIVVVQTPEGEFSGTFSPKKGKTKDVKIAKVSEDELKLKIAAAKAADLAKMIVQPGPDVPPECAAFIGGWTGVWQNGYGRNWIWVVEVDANCVIKYRFGEYLQPPFFTAVIQKGVLTVPAAENGKIFFERHGDDLWAN
jgi:hypothetical protein